MKSNSTIRSILALGLFVACQCVAAESESLTQAVQAGVDWYRIWYGDTASHGAQTLSSRAWIGSLGNRTYIALLQAGVGIELDTSGEPRPISVEPLVPNETGTDAVQRYAQRLRSEAAAEVDPNANRFNTGWTTQSQPWKVAARQGVPQITEYGVVPLPRGTFVQAGAAEQSRVVVFVRSVLMSDPLFTWCKVRKATVATFAPLDPKVFVWVERDPGCGDRLLLITRGSPWEYDITQNRFGDLDSIIAKIRERALTVIPFGEEGSRKGDISDK